MHYILYFYLCTELVILYPLLYILLVIRNSKESVEIMTKMVPIQYLLIISMVNGSHLQLSDADGDIKMSDITPENEVIEKELLDPQDVFIIDLGYHVYVWIGQGILNLSM